MGSSWIFVSFFFATVPARSSSTPNPTRHRASWERTLSSSVSLSGATSTTTPNERPQKNSSNLSLPVAYYQSPRQSQIGLVEPVCANAVDSRQGPSSSSTFRNHPAAHTLSRACMRAHIHETPGHSHLQVRLSAAGLTRDVRTFLLGARRIAEGSRRNTVSLYDVDFFSTADSLREFSPKGADDDGRARARTSCGFRGSLHESSASDRKNSLRNTRECQLRASRSFCFLSLWSATLACR